MNSKKFMDAVICVLLGLNIILSIRICVSVPTPAERAWLREQVQRETIHGLMRDFQTNEWQTNQLPNKAGP